VSGPVGQERTITEQNTETIEKVHSLHVFCYAFCGSNFQGSGIQRYVYTVNINVSYQYIKIDQKSQSIAMDIYSITCIALEIKGVKTRVVKEKDDVVEILLQSLKRQKIVLKEKDIVVVASKIVALSQGRLVKINGNLKKIIESQSESLLKTGFGYFTITDGNITANAGIDRSNVPRGTAILWPKDPYGEAAKIQARLRAHFGLKNLGVIIEDSACEPLRVGVHGMSIGHFGFKGIDDCRGKKDIYGKKFKVTRRAMADSLATAALILMGETDERVPFAVITGAPVSFINKHERKAVLRLKSDLFYGMYSDEFIKFASKCTK